LRGWLIRSLLGLIRSLLILIWALLILILALLRLIPPLLIPVLPLILRSVWPVLKLRVTQRRTAFKGALPERSNRGETEEQERRGNRRLTHSFRV
jgi:hypothetical protein